MSNRVQARCRITGTFRGKPWEYVDPPGAAGAQWIDLDYYGDVDPSTYWWSEGNFACDCNREMFLPDDMAENLPTGGESRCGELIHIDRIVPIDRPDLPALILGEDDPWSEWFRKPEEVTTDR